MMSYLQANPMAMATSPPGAGYAMPSNTLFVNNISPFCIDQELTDLFATFKGFVKLRRTKNPLPMQNGTQSVCAFVEYEVGFIDIRV